MSSMSRSAYDIAVDRINEWVKDDNTDEYLDLGDIMLTDDEFDRLKFPVNLKKLDCSSNRLTKIDLDIPTLETLLCHCNHLREINIKSSELRELHCTVNKLSKIQLSTNKLDYLACCGNEYLYLPKKYRKLFELFEAESYNVNYNNKARIIQNKYRKYKEKILCNSLGDICFMYNDINQIISLY